MFVPLLLCACGGDGSDSSIDGDWEDVESTEDAEAEVDSGNQSGEGECLADCGGEGGEEPFNVAIGFDMSEGPYTMAENEDLPIIITSLNDHDYAFDAVLKVNCPGVGYQEKILETEEYQIAANSNLTIFIALRTKHLLMDNNCFPCQIIPIIVAHNESNPFLKQIGSSVWIDPLGDNMIVYSEDQFGGLHGSVPVCD